MQHLPNILTLLRIAIIPIVVALYFFQPNYNGTNINFSWINFIIVFLLSTISITDFLDGYLARKYNLGSKLGEFLDPVADKLMIVVSLILLIDFYSLWYITVCGIIIIMREVMVSAMREWLGQVGKRANIKVSFIGKSKTFVQIFAILFLFYQSHFFYLNSFTVGIILLIIATILTLHSGIRYLIVFLKSINND